MSPRNPPKPEYAQSTGDSPSVKPARRGIFSRTVTRSLVLFLLAGLGLFAVTTSALALDCSGGVGSDFDGDGLTDLAIGDPDANVAGVARAGSVYIAYGDGAKQAITQRNIADNDNAAGDRFGHALAAVDWNQDGCSDLLVGIPFEDWSTSGKEDAGALVFIPSSADGLVTASAQAWSQASFGTAAAEAGDQFGYSLAAGDMTNGAPFLLAGAPGEMVGTVPDAGMVIYATPSNVTGISQDSPNVPGVAESGDLRLSQPDCCSWWLRVAMARAIAVARCGSQRSFRSTRHFLSSAKTRSPGPRRRAWSRLCSFWYAGLPLPL